MNEMDFTRAVISAYEYAHKCCHYGRSDLDYPVASGHSPKIDCVGLIYYALQILGKYPKKCNIDEIGTLCESVGMVKTSDINVAWKNTCVVCFQEIHNKGTNHVNHVYYSLGGKSLACINKYDLGSEERIRSEQPFFNVPVNQWQGKMDFLCAYYFDTECLPCDELELTCGVTGFVTADTGIYKGPGTKWKRIGNAKKNMRCVVYPYLITSPFGNDFRVIQTIKGLTGFILDRAVTFDKRVYFEGRVTGTDGTLNIRAGVGVDKLKIGSMKEGDIVNVNALVFDSDGTLWANVTSLEGISGFSAACHIVRT